MITHSFLARIPFKDAIHVFDSPFILDSVHGKGGWVFEPWRDDGHNRTRRGKIYSVEIPETFTIFNAGRRTIPCHVKQTLISLSESELKITSTLKPKISGIRAPVKNKTWFTICDKGANSIWVHMESKNSCYLPPPFKSMGVSAMDIMTIETFQCLEKTCDLYAGRNNF
jgi:hypothetical protein